jgi:hypothetical protein
MKATGSSTLSGRNDQATVRPPFDPEEFARQSELSTVPPPDRLPDLDPVVSPGDTTLEVLFVEADTIPVLAVAREDLEWFDLAPAVLGLLEHVDGSASLETVCARAGRPVDQGVALVEQLIRDGLVICK